MIKHTPGPWEFVDNSLVGPKLDDKPIWLRPIIFRSETGINSYDAQLIAAAPDMLEALQSLIACDFGAEGWNENAEQAAIKARAAVLKATRSKK